MYRSTKTFSHDVGLSSCFRQWRADSHCNKLHGYALKIVLTFETEDLDLRNWVVDFGSFKSLKVRFEDAFDHKTLVASDDPQIAWFREGEKFGIINMVEVPVIGCEAFARMVYEITSLWLHETGYAPRCRLISAEVCEHGANSAIYLP